VCRRQPGIENVENGAAITFTADADAVAALSRSLVEAGALIRALTPQGATLEQLFFSLTEGGGEPAPEEPTPS
jgi:hypothetical protein